MLEGVLHSLLLLVLWVTSTWHRLVDGVRSLPTLYLVFTALSAHDVQKRAQTWQKIPAHLCIAITDSPVTYEPLSRVVMWAIAAGVKHITIWDSQGMCKSSASLLRPYLEKAHALYFGESIGAYPMFFDTKGVIAPSPQPCEDRGQAHGTQPLKSVQGGNMVSRRGHSNAADTPAEDSGCCDDSDSGNNSSPADAQTRGTRIHLCDDEDGRPAVVRAIKEAAQQRISVDMAWLDSFLTDTVPEIDLVMMFSKHKMLYALLPWHLRIAEIHFCGSHRQATARTFVHTMNDFARCEQRFGR